MSLKGEVMKPNLDTIQEVIEYIDAHLEERLDLGHCSNAVHSLLSS